MLRQNGESKASPSYAALSKQATTMRAVTHRPRKGYMGVVAEPSVIMRNSTEVNANTCMWPTNSSVMPGIGHKSAVPAQTRGVGAHAQAGGKVVGEGCACGDWDHKPIGRMHMLAQGPPHVPVQQSTWNGMVAPPQHVPANPPTGRSCALLCLS